MKYPEDLPDVQLLLLLFSIVVREYRTVIAELEISCDVLMILLM